MWVLMLNGVVGYQLMDDGTALSLGFILLSAIALFIGTGYIALDTAFGWTNRFATSLNYPNQNIGLYVLYQLVPLIFLFIFFLLETFLVLRVLGERKPMRKTHAILDPIRKLLTRNQSISSPQRFCSQSVRSSSMSSAYTYATAQAARSTVPSSKPSLLSSQSS